MFRTSIVVAIVVAVAPLAAEPDFWDPRLDFYGVHLVEADPDPGQSYWRLSRAVFQDPEESGGNHNIFYTVLDRDGDPVAGQRVWQSWPDGRAPATTNAGGQADIALWGSGWCMDPPWSPGPYRASVDGPSDEVRGLGLPCNLHVNYLLTFRRTVFDPEPDRPPRARVRVLPSTLVDLKDGSARVALDGTGSDDGNGGVQGLEYLWTRLAGPGGDRFDPYASWPQGPAGIGYGDDDDATVLDDMRGAYLTVYLVTWFTIERGERVTSLDLSLRYDDGIAAYLNGLEVVRRNLSAGARYDTPAESAGEPAVETVNIDGSLGLLRDGPNLLAVEVHNASLESSDLSIDVGLAATLAGGGRSEWVRQGDTWHYLRGTAAPPRGWNDPDAPPAGATVDVVLTRPGVHRYRLRVDDGVLPERYDEAEVAITVSDPGRGWLRRGDADSSGVVEITDAVFTLGWLFLGLSEPSCLDAADSDDDSQVTLSDAVLVLSWLFQGGQPPQPPGPFACGPDVNTGDTFPDCRDCR